MGKHRARKSTDFVAKQASRFLTLPGEIRTQIYRAALVKQDSIDLWPHKLLTGIENFDEIIARLGPRDWARYHVRDQYDLRYVREQLAVGLLGTCRQARMEASRIFWSENQFCFSSDFEWEGLRRWLTTIGPEARSFISKIEVAPPHIICLVNKVDDVSSFYEKPRWKNHPKLRMAKVYSSRSNTRPGRYALESSTNDNFQFVSHMVHEERTLQKLRLMVPDGWKIARVHEVLDTDFDRLKWLDMSIVVASAAQISYEYAKEFFSDMRLPVTLMPGCLIAPQHKRPPGWGMVVQTPLECIAETTRWLPPAEESDDIFTDLYIIFDEDDDEDAARPALRAGKVDPRLRRRLKAFGGCRFVRRNGSYCNDCNQVIHWTQKTWEHYDKTKSFCVKCKGKGGTRSINDIEVRKLTRENKKQKSFGIESDDEDR